MRARTSACCSRSRRARAGSRQNSAASTPAPLRRRAAGAHRLRTVAGRRQDAERAMSFCTLARGSAPHRAGAVRRSRHAPRSRRIERRGPDPNRSRVPRRRNCHTRAPRYPRRRVPAVRRFEFDIDRRQRDSDPRLRHPGQLLRAFLRRLSTQHRGQASGRSALAELVEREQPLRHRRAQRRRASLQRASRHRWCVDPSTRTSSNHRAPDARRGAPPSALAPYVDQPGECRGCSSSRAR